LRHVLSNEGIKVEPHKVKAIIEWIRPINIIEITSFLGLAGHHRMFGKDFSFENSISLDQFVEENY